MTGEHLERVRQESDRIHGVTVFLVIMAVIGFACLCVLASWLIWRANLSAFGPKGGTRQGVVREVPATARGVNQTLFEVDSAARELKLNGLRRLDGYRWIDEEEGVAQIPIREAMRAIVAGGELR